MIMTGPCLNVIPVQGFGMFSKGFLTLKASRKGSGTWTVWPTISWDTPFGIVQSDS